MATQTPQSLASSTASNDRSNANGLFTLSASSPPPASSADNNRIDFVFVHGLGGHYRRTWTHPNGFFWPDELVNSLPGSRAFSYGYPSQIFASRSVAGIQDFATELLERLRLTQNENVSVCPTQSTYL